MTLTEFLEERIAEDEANVLDHWDSDGKARIASMWTGRSPGYTTVASDRGDSEWFADGRAVTDARYVRVLFDPARVLAECEAKRRIVELHTPVDENPDGWCNRCDGDGWPCGTMAALALPYAEHPDYDETWRP